MRAFAFAILLSLAAMAPAAPVTFEEISLLVRMREHPNFITKEVTTRRLTRHLTGEQEATLKSQGASDALLERLRNPAHLLTESELAAWEQQQQRWQLARMSKPGRRATRSLTPALPPLPAEPALGALPP